MSKLNTVARLSHIIWPSQKDFGLATLLLVTTFIQTTCIALAPSHQTFDTALLYLIFSLPLTTSSQNARPPDTAIL